MWLKRSSGLESLTDFRSTVLSSSIITSINSPASEHKLGFSVDARILPGFPRQASTSRGLTCCVCWCTVRPSCQAALLPASTPRCDVPRQTGSVCRGLGPRSSRPPPGPQPRHLPASPRQQPRHLPASPGQHSAVGPALLCCRVYCADAGGGYS